MKFFLSLICFCAYTAQAGTNELFADASSWTGHVYLAIIGDSISGGGGGAGIGINGLPYSITNASSGHLTVTNSSVGGTRWTNSPGQLAAALTQSPRWVFVQFGRNDLLTCFITNQVVPCYWPVIADYMEQAASNCNRVGSRLMVGEVFPAYTNYTEWATPGIRLLNQSYAIWCATNSYSNYTKMCIQHDYFAVTNPETANLDWLNWVYQQSPADGLHLSALAYTNWGPLIVNRLGELFPAGITVNIGTLNTR